MHILSCWLELYVLVVHCGTSTFNLLVGFANLLSFFRLNVVEHEDSKCKPIKSFTLFAVCIWSFQNSALILQKVCKDCTFK